MVFRRSYGFQYILVALIAFASGVAAAPPDEPSETQLKIYKHGALVLTLPAGWRGTTKPGARTTSPPTMTITGPGHPLEVLITPLWSTTGDSAFNSPAEVRKSAETTGQSMLADRKETSITLQELNGTRAQGFYYTLTEKHPALGSYEFVSNAFLGAGELLVTATILHHQKDSEAFRAALEMLKSIDQAEATDADTATTPNVDPATKLAMGAVAAKDNRGIAMPNKGAPSATPSPNKSMTAAATDKTGKSVRAPSKVPAAPAGPGLRLPSPDGTWSVVLPVRYVRQTADTNFSRTAISYQAADEASGVQLVIKIEPAAGADNSIAARGAFWDKASAGPIPKQNVQLREVKDKAIVSYVSIAGQQEMNIFMLHNDLQINVHVVKTDFKPTDQPLLEAIINGLKIEDPAQPAQK